MSDATRSTADVPSGGLTAAEAGRRLQADGPNELPSQRPRNLVAITKEVLAEPMFALLIAAAAIYVVLGDVREAVILACSVVVIVAISALQQRRTEHALAALRDLSSPRALVLRDGEVTRIAGREVVAGDVVLLREGDRVPADATLRTATALSVDESILTGESLPVEKTTCANEAQDDTARVFSGSLVVAGFGSAEVFATGVRSEIGKIGRALTTLETGPTPLFREVRRIVRWVATAGLLICAAVAVIYALTRSDWLGGVLAGITLTMSILPEEFPVVLTVFLAMGAWRMSRTGVLTRRMPAVETIGSATVLAVDKTGTLTENRMRVALIEADGRAVDLRHAAAEPDAAQIAVLATAMAASERNAFDPMERAIHEAGRRHASIAAARLDALELVREYDLTTQRLAVTHAWRAPGSRSLDIAVKGAPETVATLCRADAATRDALHHRVVDYAKGGLRVLAVARGVYPADVALPSDPEALELELIGLVAMADPLRADVPAALEECARAGIRVVMITGDHPGTAIAIAAQAGFDVSGGVVTGHELESMSEATLTARTQEANVYARARPEHKLRLVQALQANGEVVAMTGDGVNDAPALKAADVGVAMGARGTDVAREAAALVLVNDDFASLVAAVRLGRRIYGNIRHAMSYIVAVHIPIAGLGLLPVLFGWPLLFYPVHVLFLEFVIDPACAFVFEADREAPDVMQRNPRPPGERLFTPALLRRSLTLGLVVLVFSVATFGVALKFTSDAQARALAFVAIVVSNLALIFVSRTRSESLRAVFAKTNPVFWGIACAALAVLAASIGVRSVADVFRFGVPPWQALVAVVAGSVGLVLWSGRVLRDRSA